MSTSFAKNITLSFFRNMWLSLAYPASARGAYRDRHGRWKRDAVDAWVVSALVARTKQSWRTAKACGPGPPMLGSSFAGDGPQSDGGNQSPVSGESPL